MVTQGESLITGKASSTLPTPPPPFYEPSYESIPAAGINTVYVIESRSTLACYVGSTCNALGRLALHNSRRGAVITAWVQDWRFKACVLGFPNGREGLAEARSFETKLLHFPSQPHLPFFEWLRAIHFLLDKENVNRPLSPLWAQLF